MAVLHRLIALLHFFTTKDRVGENPVEAVFGRGKKLYHARLKELATIFVNTVHELSVQQLDYVGILDKPNLHRIIELTMHTIPLYHHTRHVSDLFFEKKHRSLKRSIERAKQTDNNEWGMYADCMD